MKDDIVIPAWEVASSNVAIKIFNFFPSLLSSIYLSLILLYQVAWSYINVFGLKDQFFGWVVNFVHNGYFFEVATAAVVFFLLFIFVTPLAEGGLIALIDRTDRHGNSESTMGYGISRGLKHFLPVFEANNIMALFKLLSIITFTLFLIRLMGVKYLSLILTGIGIYFFVAMTINIVLAYTRFFIVLEGMKAYDAIVASAGMALDNLRITAKLYLTLLLVYVRTLLTVLVFILLPFVLSAIFTYVTIASIKILFLIILILLLVGFIVFISHLNSVLEIFVETLWYRAYIDNKSRAVPASSDHHDDHGHDDHSGHNDHGHADHH